MSLQRQHFLLSYLKTLSVGPAGVRTHDLPLGSPVLNQLSQPVGGKVGQMLAENATLRNEVEELKNAQQENNQQIDTLTSKMAQVTSQLNAMEKKTNEQQAYIEQLEENLEDLVPEKDALEQYARKYNVEIHGVLESSDENLLELIPFVPP